MQSLIFQNKQLFNSFKAQNSIIYSFSSNRFSKQANQKVRVRYAPSPTGYLHIGGLRTALYNYIFAKKNNGQFILRIEDTDRNRLVEDSVDKLMESLNYLGLKWDEGPGIQQDQVDENKKVESYYQSDRTHLYKKYAQKLIDSGDAYHCFCTPQRLTELRESQQKQKQKTKYDKKCLHLSQDEVIEKLKNNEKSVIRMNVREGQTEIKDLIHGNIIFENEQIDDQVLIKTDGYPTYHLANVVDDYLMKITHVIRGEEWLTSTPKHIMLYNYFNIKPPQFAHIPLITNKNGKKLSKRQADASIDYYIDKGIQKESLLNFISLLGWRPSVFERIEAEKGSLQLQDQLLNIEDIIDMFSIDKVQRKNSVMDEQLLLKFNQHYLKNRFYKLAKDKQVFKDFQSVVLQQLQDLNDKILQTQDDKIKQIYQLILERLQTVKEIQNYRFFWEQPTDFNSQHEKKLFKKKDLNLINEIINKFRQIAEHNQYNFESESINQGIGTYLYETQSTENPLKNEDGYHFFRLILSGSKNGPPAGQIAEIVGFDETIKRLDYYQNQITEKYNKLSQ